MVGDKKERKINDVRSVKEHLKTTNNWLLLSVVEASNLTIVLFGIIELSLTYNILFVSGVQLIDSVFVYEENWSPL